MRKFFWNFFCENFGRNFFIRPLFLIKKFFCKKCKNMKNKRRVCRVRAPSYKMRLCRKNAYVRAAICSAAGMRAHRYGAEYIHCAAHMPHISYIAGNICALPPLFCGAYILRRRRGQGRGSAYLCGRIYCKNNCRVKHMNKKYCKFFQAYVFYCILLKRHMSARGKNIFFICAAHNICRNASAFCVICVCAAKKPYVRREKYACRRQKRLPPSVYAAEGTACGTKNSAAAEYIRRRL